MRVRELRDQLAARASDHPDEFGPDGSTRAKTEAAKLHRDLKAAENPPLSWQRREQDAADKVATARRAVERFTADHADQLILDLKPGRDADDQLIIDKLNELDAMLKDRIKFAQHVAKLLAPVPGLDAVREIPNADDVAELRKTIHSFLAAGLRPTLPLSICTPEGQTPPRVKTASGQWIGIQHAHDIDQHSERKREEQEERDRHGRRRVQIHPPQPQPTGRSPLDETLSALLDGQ